MKQEARPSLPKPNCRVLMVCGPVAAGKSTYVRNNAEPDDIIIDFDAIAKEMGWGRHRPQEAFAPVMAERNKRLAGLAVQPASRKAWFIACAPSRSLRRWWCDVLNVKPEDLIVLVPSRAELIRRIQNDPDRIHVQQIQFVLVDKWFNREHNDNPGYYMGGYDSDGIPIDPLHPWNQEIEFIAQVKQARTDVVQNLIG